MTDRPLNGTKTRPLKAGSIDILRRLAKARMGVHKTRINPGVRDRLSRESLAYGPDRFGYWYITDAGRARLEEIDGKDKG